MRHPNVDPKVTALLGKIILSHKADWRSAPDAGWTLEQVKEQSFPEREVYQGSCAAIVLEGQSETDALLEEVKGLLQSSGVTNKLVYPPHSCMRWHTNSDTQGVRTYYTFSVKAGVFIYKDQETGEIVEDVDKVGWTVRQFDVNAEKPFWHCVWSDGIRFSFGFNSVAT